MLKYTNYWGEYFVPFGYVGTAPAAFTGVWAAPDIWYFDVIPLYLNNAGFEVGFVPVSDAIGARSGFPAVATDYISAEPRPISYTASRDAQLFGSLLGSLPSVMSTIGLRKQVPALSNEHGVYHPQPGGELGPSLVRSTFLTPHGTQTVGYSTISKNWGPNGYFQDSQGNPLRYIGGNVGLDGPIMNLSKSGTGVYPLYRTSSAVMRILKSTFSNFTTTSKRNFWNKSYWVTNEVRYMEISGARDWDDETVFQPWLDGMHDEVVITYTLHNRVYRINQRPPSSVYDAATSQVQIRITYQPDRPAKDTNITSGVFYEMYGLGKLRFAYTLTRTINHVYGQSPDTNPVVIYQRDWELVTPVLTGQPQPGHLPGAPPNLDGLRKRDLQGRFAKAVDMTFSDIVGSCYASTGDAFSKLEGPLNNIEALAEVQDTLTILPDIARAQVLLREAYDVIVLGKRSGIVTVNEGWRNYRDRRWLNGNSEWSTTGITSFERITTKLEFHQISVKGWADLLTSEYLKFSFGTRPVIELLTVEIPRIIQAIREWRRTNNVILRGKYQYDFPEGTFGRSASRLTARTKVVFTVPESWLGDYLLVSQQLGILPTFGNAWDIRPWSFVADYFLSIGKRIRAAEASLSSLVYDVNGYVHTWKVVSDVADDEISDLGLKSSSVVGVDHPTLGYWRRELSRYYPEPPTGRRFDFLSPAGGPPWVTVGALLYQLLT